MAVVYAMEIPEGTQDFYEAVWTAMNWPEDWPEGQIAHYAGPAEGNWRVVDVWESKEHFDRFAQERLGPAFQQVSGAEAPALEPDSFEVHNEVTAQARV